MAVLHSLVKANAIEAVRALLRPGAATGFVDQLDDDGYTPLFLAVSAKASMPEMTRLLLERGANPDYVRVQEIPLLDAANVEAALTGMGLELPKSLFGQSAPTEFRESLLSAAIKRGHVEVIEVLREFGADLAYRNRNGYTAVLDAIHGEGDRLPIVRYLIGLGLDVRGVSSYGETALRAAYHRGMFQVVAELLAAGANEGDLGWTPLMRAVSLGSREDVERELSLGGDLNAKDTWDRSAMHLALLRGDVAIAELLRAFGADPLQPGQMNHPSLAYAAESGCTEAVEWIVALGAQIDQPDYLGRTALATAAEAGDIDMVRTLLSLGADPNAELQYGASVLEDAASREVILTLIDHGADPAGLKHEARRKLLGLDRFGKEELDSVTRQEYLRCRHLREGRSNPEEISEPFLIAMIRSGVNAYQARVHFDDQYKSVCRTTPHSPEAVWCAQRFGQSTTILPDGRIVLIGGEHEDGYDPDFCIYNDVLVFSPDGEIRVFGYPSSLFPPTDFHTATLAGRWIYIIGALGYFGTRTGTMPVYRLSIDDFHIEPVATTGVDPGRIFGHRATLMDSHLIGIDGGTRITVARKKEDHSANRDAYLLDLRTHAWSRA